MTIAPTMQRSRGQLATSYAPNCLFTFEGGVGACMALSTSGNRETDLRPITKRMIGDQIQEYFEAWASRAMRGQNLRHPVPPALAVDGRVLSGQSVQVRIGELVFQVPELIGYVPFPLAFSCTRCGLHRECRNYERVTEEVEKFHSACPTGATGCADDWQQIDVVLTHWSGDVEAISPTYRYWDSNRAESRDIARCSSCDSERFYLRKPPGPLAGWHFECVICRTVRQILQRDHRTLELLGPLLDQNQAIYAEVNMEPVSYRASAAYYAHGDRILVLDQDEYMSLLGATRVGDLEGAIASSFGYPPTALSDAEKERLLRSAGRGSDWDDYSNIRDLVRLLERDGKTPQQMIEASRSVLAKYDNEWNATVFAGRQQATPGVTMACRERQKYVQRFDPVRMAMEHQTFVQEKLRGGQLPDGKEISVDIAILDPFLMPDDLSAPESERLKREVSRRRDLLGIAEMRVVRDVRVCEYTFAYTRTSSSPIVKREKAGDADLPVRLRLFDRVEVGDTARHPVLCLVQQNEGLYVRLDEGVVREWLEANGIVAAATPPGVALGGSLIEEFAAIENTPGLRFSRFLDEYRREKAIPRQAYPFVYTLLHSMSHHLLGICASMSGLDLGSFGEHIFASDLAFLLYRRGMTMDLGNLTSMWRDRGDPDLGNEVLSQMVNPSSLRCGSESVCNHRGGACPDCMLIPETACLTRNELLSRSVLIGRGNPKWDMGSTPVVGFYTVAGRRFQLKNSAGGTK